MRKISSLTLASVAALAACGQPGDSAGNTAGPENAQMPPEEILVNDTSGVDEPNAAEPVQRPPDAELSIPPVPPPPPKEDPHAGHDMGNKANGQ